MNNWQSKFGDDYTKRNSDKHFENVLNFWLAFGYYWFDWHDTKSVIELGCNIGTNLKALKRILPRLELSGYDINKEAVLAASRHQIKAILKDITKPIKAKADFVFTRGVLIHIPKKKLPAVYRNLYNISNKYILIMEYHSPERRMIKYRGRKDLLWTDDYAKPLIKMGCRLIECGFEYEYHLTWFLLKKGGGKSDPKGKH